MMLLKGVVVAAVLACAVGDGAELGTGARLLVKIYEECSRKGLVPCLKVKAINFFGRASRSKEIQLGEAMTLVRDGVGQVHEALTDADLDESVPRGAEEARDKRLNDLLFRRMAEFVNSHKLMVSLPKLNPMDIQEGIEEGRGKMKKMMSMMMMGFAMKLATVVPMALGLLLLLAGKALIMSKIAFVLSFIMALKKLLQKQSHGHHDVSWHSGGGWDRRSLPEPSPDANGMAYSAYSGYGVNSIGEGRKQ